LISETTFGASGFFIIMLRLLPTVHFGQRRRLAAAPHPLILADD